MDINQIGTKVASIVVSALPAGRPRKWSSKMRSIVNAVTLSLVGALIAGPALASVPSNGIVLPEPGMIGLFAAGAVAVILLKNRNRK